MVNFPKSGRGQPLPDLGDFVLAFNLAQSVFGALSNHVTGGATVLNNQAAPQTVITSPLITRKSGGVFLVWATCTISIAGGALADTDEIIYNPTRVTPGAVALNPVQHGVASTMAGGAAGYTVGGLITSVFIDTPGIALGATASYGVTVTNTNAHNFGVVAVTDGQIVVLELPG